MLDLGPDPGSISKAYTCSRYTDYFIISIKYMKAVLERTGKDKIQLQNSRGIKASEWKQGSKDYIKFLKKGSNPTWEPVMNANRLFHKCSIIHYYQQPSLYVQPGSMPCVPMLMTARYNHKPQHMGNTWNSKSITSKKNPKKLIMAETFFSGDDTLPSACFMKWSCIYQFKNRNTSYIYAGL